MGKQARLNAERLALTKTLTLSGSERCLLRGIGIAPAPKSFNDVEAMGELFAILKISDAKIDDKPKAYALTVEKLKLLDRLIETTLQAGIWNGVGAMEALPVRNRVKEVEQS